MIDCFITTCQGNALRHALYRATCERLLMQTDLDVKIIVPLPHESPIEFRMNRRKKAEQLATTPIYFLCDDDVLPFSMNFVANALRILKENPEFKFACLRPQNVHIDIPDGLEEIVETDMSAIGGANFIYKGIIDSWPDGHSEADGWNQWEPKLIRSKGYKVGMFRNIWMNHIGVGFSTLWHNDNG